LKNEAKSINEILKNGIAARLLETLSKNGYKNSRKPYYVDAKKFAEELNISTTMLRRYLSGEALPSSQTIELAAELLHIDAIWLYCGYKKTNIDEDLLKKIIKKMTPILIKSYKGKPESLDEKIDYLVEIYKHITLVQTSDEVEKSRLIGWMLENIINQENIDKDNLTASSA
jgi:transcriptional regulator with XRE-family HTH domain